MNYLKKFFFLIADIKHFIAQDDKKTVGKVLKGIELANIDKVEIFNEWVLQTYSE